MGSGCRIGATAGKVSANFRVYALCSPEKKWVTSVDVYNLRCLNPVSPSGVLAVACCSCQPRTPEQQQQYLQDLDNSVNGASFHADLPFLGNSKKKIWYLFLVIAILGETHSLAFDMPG